MLSVSKSAPFLHADNGVPGTMFRVVLALLPALVFNLWLFGWPALFLLAVTISSCLALEAACLRLAGKAIVFDLLDGSALVTACLLAMSLPPWAPWWTGVFGAIVAIGLSKHAYGGLGQNLFNPAMVARVALLVSFPVVMTSWVASHPWFSAGSPGFSEGLAITFGGHFPDALSSATPLGHVKTELSRGVSVIESASWLPSLSDMALGLRAGSLGETSAVLILAGGLFLLASRVISWHIPVALLLGLILPAGLAHLANPARYAGPLFHLFSGASFLGAFFIATDYVSSPSSNAGKLVYGLGCGLLTWIIRSYAGYPEGMAFAILLMNALAPIIEQYTRPRVFGRTRSGKPLVFKGDVK